MTAVPNSRPPRWVNRDLPHAPLHQPRGHSASRAGPSY